MKTTMYYLEVFSGSETETDRNKAEWHTDYEKACESGRKALAYPDQGRSHWFELSKVIIDNKKYLAEHSEAEGNITNDVEENYTSPHNVEYREWAEIEWQMHQEYAEHEDISGKFIVAYRHKTFMNYAHDLEKFYFAKNGMTTEDLSDNPDHTFRTWEMVTDLTISDFEGLSEEDTSSLINEQLRGLKHGGYHAIEKCFRDSAWYDSDIEDIVKRFDEESESEDDK